MLSMLATEMASMPLPGLEEYHEPNAPSFPAAIVTTLPCAAIRLATTDPVPSVHPSHTTQGQRKNVHSVVVPANQGIDDNCITGGTEDTVCGNRSFAWNTTDAKCIVGISADNSGNMSSMASALVQRVIIGNEGIGTSESIADKVVAADDQCQ